MKYLNSLDVNKQDETLDKSLDRMFKRLRLPKKKVNILKAIGTLVVCAHLNISVRKMEKLHLINQRFKKVSDFLEVHEQHLELLIDIFSANPIRIFREEQNVSDKDHKRNGFEETKNARHHSKSMNIPVLEFTDSRISLLSETFHISKSNLESFGSLWVSSYEFCFRGNNNLREFADCLGIDIKFLDILMLKHRTHSEVQNNAISMKHKSHVMEEYALDNEIANFLSEEIKEYKMSSKYWQSL